ISSRPELASFFQFGNGISGNPLTQLDGGVAIRQDEVGDVIYFSRVLQGPIFLTPGAQVEAETVFSIINPSDEQIQIEARYFRTTGVNDFNPSVRVIPPRGAIRETFPELFGNTPPLMDGYVQVQLLQGSQVTGFQLIRLPDSVFGLNAFQPGQVNTIYSAQLANGGSPGAFSFTNLNLVNTSNQLLEVTITAVDENGVIINVPQIVALNPNASLQRDASEFFGLGLPSSAAVRTGSIIVEADQPGLVGDVIFGDPVNFDTAAAMQLQSQTFSEAFFSQVANNNLIFTGLAIFNPSSSETAQVTIQVFDMEGNLAGETLLELGPENRISQVLAQLVAEAANQVGGYIRLQSNVPIVAQELFGNNGLTFLSAVPPQADTP
ncbi:MAG TPA: hypothetical protein VLV83_06375, partial [Acidobacteriota bacterium]|nr:hypothetical protein [Acidobacteriota bacterium]